MKKDIIGLVIGIYSIISVIMEVTKDTASGVIFLPIACGGIIAMIFYARRYLPQWREIIVKGYIALIALATAVSLIMPIISGQEGVLGNMVNNLVGGICTAAVVLLCNNKKLYFVEVCAIEVFVIIVMFCVVMVPLIMTMLTGMLKSLLTSVLFLYLFVVLGFALYPRFKDKFPRK